MAPEAGPSLVAVLFTDLVGSTALRSSLGEERADRLRRVHDELLTGYVEANGGRVLKGTGDGLVAAFGSASDSLTAAVEMQRAIHRHNRAPGALAQLVGADVLFGRCDEDLAVPYQPFVTALRDFVAATPVARLREELAEHHLAELARVLPELGVLVGDRGSAGQADPEAERYRLFEAVRAWLKVAAGGDRPLLLVLDDLQWAESATVALLAHLARSEPLPLAVLATLRDTEALPRPLANLLDAGAAGVAARTLALRGLGEAGVGRLVEDATGRSAAGDTSALARRIHAETAGNPLFVATMMSGLETGSAGGEMPTDVRSAVRRGTSGVSPAAQDLLRVGALIGLEFDLRVVARVLGVGVPAVLDAADEVVAAHLAEEVGPNRTRFAHALVRSALRQEVRPSRAAHLHGAIAEALEVVHADRLDEHAESLAHHFGEALRGGGSAAKALDYRLRAAGRAVAQYAHDAAVAHYWLAVGVLESDGRVGERVHCEVLGHLGGAEFHSAEYADARATLRRAAAEAEAGGWPELLARAAIDLEHATSWPGLAGDESAELLGRAGERLGPADTTLTAQVLTGLERHAANELSFTLLELGRMDETAGGSRANRVVATPVLRALVGRAAVRAGRRGGPQRGPPRRRGATGRGGPGGRAEGGGCRPRRGVRRADVQRAPRAGPPRRGRSGPGHPGAPRVRRGRPGARGWPRSTPSSRWPSRPGSRSRRSSATRGCWWRTGPGGPCPCPISPTRPPTSATWNAPPCCTGRWSPTLGCGTVSRM